MAKIKTLKQFNESIDTAFETQKTRDEAKACYEFQRDELKLAEKEICDYSAEHPEVFAGNDDASAWGSTGTVDFTISNGRTVERLDGGKLSDAAFIEALPRKYVRVKRELNKAKLKADGLDVAALEQLGLKYVSTRTLRLVASA